ncbi:MAG: hypothetical protein A3F46_03325 [Legionellales bacterium RIFCSPHIGHO2_12_FULL_42_9]|nr:MAG: hypothetical protein A3F46_03325 [Legionellales bacterium RIFCSPHIGHO2_12_FULL_42_9]
MLNLKKTAVAVLALGSSAVFAGTMGPVCAPGNVTVPCERTAWNVGAQALYLQPVYALEGNYPQVAVSGGDQSTNAAQANYHTATTPYQWGFMVEGSYHFGMGNDINVNWYRVHNTNDVAYPTADTTALANSTKTFNGQSATANPQWDQVDVELGQHIDFGDMKSVRLHGGVEYARVTTAYNTQVNNLAISTQANSSYNGFGPRGGVDAKYQLGNGFSVYGKGAGSILVGPSSFSNSTVVNSSTSTSPASSAFGSSTLIVPELEGKLGVNYDYAMAQGDLTLDIGWMWINYFNAQQSALDGRNVNDAGTLLSRGFMSSTDFGLQGLYFGGKWTGNV